MHPNVHCSTAYNNQDMEAAQMPTGREIDKEYVVLTHNVILLSHEVMQFAAILMDLKNFIRSKPKANVISYHLYLGS